MNTTVKASYKGTILSSTLNTGQPMNCTLNLTGIAGNSWLKLWLSDVKDQKKLECPKNHESNFNYITLAGGINICDENDEILHYFQPGFILNTAELQFQTSKLENRLQFNLNYRGSKYIVLKKLFDKNAFNKKIFFAIELK